MGRSESSQERTVNLEELFDQVFNMIVFRLSPILGGRSEVLETPVLEALSYLDMEKEEKERDRLERFHFLFFGANSKVSPKARKSFYEGIKPKKAGKKLLDNPNKKMEWNYSAMDEFRAK